MFLYPSTHEGALMASNSANGVQPLLLALLSAALTPLLRCIADWIQRGDLTDADDDFFVSIFFNFIHELSFSTG